MSTHSFHAASNASQAEARCLTGKVDGTFRLKKVENESLDMDSMTQRTMDYYQRLVNEIKRGERMPVKLGKWKSVESNYQRFLIDRIAPNFAQFKKSSVDGIKMAMIPASYSAPHPTFAEKQAYMSRWNDDGDLYKEVMAECKKYSDTAIIIHPQVIHSLPAKSLLMIAVHIISIPKEIMYSE